MRVKVLVSTTDKSLKAPDEVITNNNTFGMNKGNVRLVSDNSAYINDDDTNIIIDSISKLDLLLPDSEPCEFFWCMVVSTNSTHRLVSEKFPINSLYHEYIIDDKRGCLILWSKKLHSWIVAVNS